MNLTLSQVTILLTIGNLWFCIFGFIIGRIIVHAIKNHLERQKNRKAAQKRVEKHQQERTAWMLSQMNAGYIGKPFTESDLQ